MFTRLIAAATALFTTCALTSCKLATLAVIHGRKTEESRAVLSELLPSIVLATAFYLTIKIMLQDSTTYTKANERALKGWTAALCVSEFLAPALPDVGAGILVVVELVAMVLIPYKAFNLSLGKSFSVLGICVAATIITVLIFG